MSAWLDVKEAAALAKASVPTVRRAIKAGALRAYRLQPGGRLLRVRAADVNAWLAAQAESGASS